MKRQCLCNTTLLFARRGAILSLLIRGKREVVQGFAESRRFDYGGFLLPI